MTAFNSEFRSISSQPEPPFDPAEERQKALFAVAACRRRRQAFDAEVARRTRQASKVLFFRVPAIVAAGNHPVGT